MFRRGARLIAQGNRLHAEALQRMALAFEGTNVRRFLELINLLFGEGPVPSEDDGPPAKRHCQAEGAPLEGGESSTQTTPLWDLGRVAEAVGFVPLSDDKLHDIGLMGNMPKPISRGRQKRVYQCPMGSCTHRTTGRTGMTTHIRRHLGTALRCIKCSKNYFHSDSYKDHIAKKHPALNVFELARKQCGIPEGSKVIEVHCDSIDDVALAEALSLLPSDAPTPSGSPDPAAGGDSIVIPDDEEEPAAPEPFVVDDEEEEPAAPQPGNDQPEPIPPEDIGGPLEDEDETEEEPNDEQELELEVVLDSSEAEARTTAAPRSGDIVMISDNTISSAEEPSSSDK